MSGFSVLDISKTLMYDFHYNVIKATFGENAKLLFTDTDSVCYNIQSTDLHGDLKEISPYFDFSDYPSYHVLYSEANKKVVGKFKDECNGYPPVEFVGLRSKLYSLLVSPTNNKQAMKGIPRRVIHSHDEYKSVLFSNSSISDTFHSIRSYHHKIYTVPLTKISLSSFDDKRYLLEDGISSLPYGHYCIPQ